MIITCIGDCGIDNYLSDGLKRSGGITLNFAVHARKLFPRTDMIEVLTVLGDDEGSKLVAQTIKEQNLEALIEYRRGNAPVQYINRTKKGEKVFTKYDEGVLKDFVLSSKQKAYARQSDFLITPLYTQIEPLFYSVLKLQIKGLKSVDFMDLSDYGKDTFIVETSLNHFDIGFFGLDKTDDGLLSALQKLSKQKQKLFVVTLGKDGSIAFQNGEKFYQNTELVKNVIDTTGAGDAFAAAFTKHFLYTKDIKRSLNEGNEYAKRIVQHIGTF